MSEIDDMTFKDEAKMDARAQAIQNNPCSTCRAFGSPVCRGHGGGGSAGSSGEG